MNFECDKCGACCRHLSLFGKEYAWLNDGSGKCKYLDNKTSLCTIYEIRPIICRVDEGYYRHFNHISIEEYLKITENACKSLKNIKI